MLDFCGKLAILAIYSLIRDFLRDHQVAAVPLLEDPATGRGGARSVRM
jgi:hypothetical protein